MPASAPIRIDQLFEQATSELDPAKAIQITNDIDKLIWEEVHSLPLYQRPEIVAIKAGVANMGAYGFADIIYEDIGWVNGGE
jgi:peptide/nickel transport system substrate-binding protein